MTLGQGEFKCIPSLKEDTLFIRLLVTVERRYGLIMLLFTQWLRFGADGAEETGQEGS